MHMKKGFRKACAASGAALALSMSGCAGGEAMPARLSLAPEASAAVDVMGKACAAELVENNATTEVVRSMVGSTVIFETPQKTFIFAGKQEVQSNAASALGSVASGDLRIISWENSADQGSTATVIRNEGVPTELLVHPDQGTDVSIIIGAACVASLK